jgi:hypothetical protein
MCSICGEESTRICSRCTKDACNNHLCEKCYRCSDCCECEVTLSDSPGGISVGSARSVFRATAVPKPDADPEPTPHPPPDPDPFPEDEPDPGVFHPAT